MKTRKIIAAFFTIILAITLIACGKTTEKNKDSEVNKTTIENSVDKEEKDEQKADAAIEQKEDEQKSEQTEKEEPSKPEEGHEHSYKTEVVTATCSKGGYTLNSCDCGDKYKTDKVDAIGHSYGGWNTVKEATTLSKGKAERVCSLCKKVDSKELDKLPLNHKHSYKDKVVKPTCTSKGYTVHTCECGDSYTDKETSKTDHSYSTKITSPTCAAEGYTTYTCGCGDTYIGDKTSKTSHIYTNKAVNASCTTGGYVKHTCSKCGSTYIDGQTSATGHSYNVTSNTATCTADGKKTETCGNCGDKKISNASATGHDTTTETKSATCISKGYTKVTCKKCKTVVSNTEIPKVKEHKWKTKILSQAALEANENGISEYMGYLKASEHNVKMCDLCKYVDLSSATSIYSDYEKAQIMLGYVNQLRREVLGEGYDLVLDNRLIELSVIRSKEIVTNFSHYGGTFTNAGENILKGSPTIKSQFNDWKNSSGHYANMLQKEYKSFGYASFVDFTKYSGAYGVQLFW